MTAALMSKALAGDDAAFGELTEPYRRQLLVHCYRMLGSFHDAEDVLQEHSSPRGAARRIRGTLFAAHVVVPDRHEPLPQRPTCRHTTPGQALGRAQRRTPDPTRLGEVPWLEPFPDALLAGALEAPNGPEARSEQREAISLAFVTALQLLPPRQVAVLILRDVLGYHAEEVADMLGSTVESANSALKRAREPAAARRDGQGSTARTRLPGRESDPHRVRGVVAVRRPRCAGEAPHRRRVHVDATNAVRVRRPRHRRPLLRQHLRRRPQVRPRPHPRQRPARIRRLSAHCNRQQSRRRPLRLDPCR